MGSTLSTGCDFDATLERGHSVLRQGLPVYARAEILGGVSELLSRDREQVAQLICREVDKPIKLARLEVDRAVGTFAVAAAVARTRTTMAHAMDALPAGTDKLAFSIPVAMGLVAAITPFNFPINLVAHKLAPALAAGCPVVLKPAPRATGCALALASLFDEAGLPDGWLAVLDGPAEQLGEVLTADERIAVITFTGSTTVGWHLAERAARKKVLLELGNSAPAIVHRDADIERAAELLARNSFAYAGQSCVSVQRIYVHEQIVDHFLEQLLLATRHQVIGDPSNEAVDVGPVIDDRAAERLRGWIAEALGLGAHLATGGGGAGRHVEPTVLVDVPHASPLIQCEAFGPVVSVGTFDALDDAIDASNDTPYGLQAAVFTRDLNVALTAARALQFGGVLINEAPTFRADNAPYGGGGDSGNTREGPAAAVAELTEDRLVVLQTAGHGT